MWKGPGCSQTGNSVRNFSSGQGWPAGFINKDGCLHRSKTETEEEEVEVGESISNLLIYSRLLETQGVSFCIPITWSQVRFLLFTVIGFF